VAKPWTLDFKHGHQSATIDGVCVYLLEPAVLDPRTRKGKPSALDHKHTVGPLVNAQARPLVQGRPVRVFIDPGHGGADSGALSQDRKLVESRVVLDIAKRLAAYLAQTGFDVKLSRQDNTTSLLLEERTFLAARWKADIFVSIHINATADGDPGAYGLETFILPPAGACSTYGRSASTDAQKGNGNDVRNMQLGFAIQRRTVKTSKMADRGLRRARFTVLRDAPMPAALVECGFISSPRDRKILNTAEGRERLARGIFQGICDYAYGTLAPGLPAHAPGGKDTAVGSTTPPPINKDATPTPIAPRRPVVLHGTNLPDKVVVPNRKPAWTPPPIPEDKKEDPRLQKIREEAARAAGF
jgi:N-acetylmuramoyl-L-alanine amidase